MIHIEDLAFSYKRRGTRSALFAGLSLDLEQGGIYGLLGRNGAGKTSLLRLISGQLFRSSGNCTVLGQEPQSRRPSLLRQIYFLPEEFHVPQISGYAYLDAYAPFYPAFDAGRFTELVSEFEIDPEAKLSSCSYGQKKKFLLAFALASGCRVLILDEPTNGLDIPSKRQFRRAVAASLGEHQLFLISTHQVRDMENLIDPIIILESGRIVFNRRIEDVSTRMSVANETNEPTGSGVIYSEKNVGGYTVLRRGAGSGGAVDLELLFNAIVESPAEVNAACDGLEV